MKRNIMEKILIIVFLATISLQLPSFYLSKNASSAIAKENIVSLPEDILQDESSIDDFEKYLEKEFGPNYKEIIDKNWASAELADKIIQEFSLTTSSDINYPDYIGGMYINDDNNLVLQIVKEKIPKTKSKDYNHYKKITTTYDNVIYEEVKYSYSELQEVKKKIEDYYKEHYSFETTAFYDGIKTKIMSYRLGDGVSGLGLDELNNRVVVYLYNNSESERSKFKETVLDSPIILFKENTATQKDIFGK